MDKHCKHCEKLRMARPDRPGKFRTTCVEHFNEYMAKKNRESYVRHREKRVAKSQRYRDEHPDAAMDAYRIWISNPDNHAKKKEYMRLYNSPHRAHIKDACEVCGWPSRREDRRDLDVHHLDFNHGNNDPTNLQTLCVPCHRDITHPR